MAKQLSDRPFNIDDGNLYIIKTIKHNKPYVFYSIKYDKDTKSNITTSKLDDAKVYQTFNKANTSLNKHFIDNQNAQVIQVKDILDPAYFIVYTDNGTACFDKSSNTLFTKTDIPTVRTERIWIAKNIPYTNCFTSKDDAQAYLNICIGKIVKFHQQKIHDLARINLN